MKEKLSPYDERRGLGIKKKIPVVSLIILSFKIGDGEKTIRKSVGGFLVEVC
ncbi:MAG: hypothetical protein QW461_03140 [Candidatus Jordarchaeales archaeon]